jgi:hypothetical protein
MIPVAVMIRNFDPFLKTELDINLCSIVTFYMHGLFCCVVFTHVLLL